MRTLLPAGLCLSLAMAGWNACAQNAPAANTKPAEQKSAAATAEAKKPAEEKKSADTSSAAGKPDAKANAKTDSKGDSKGDNKAASGKDTKADPKAAASAPADEKDERKSAKADGPPCVVAEFRALGIEVHDPAKRRTQAMSWLKKRAKQCSVDQLLMIRNNRSQWMGSADSAAMAAEVDALLEVFAADNPQVAALLYGTVPPPAEPK